MTSPRIDLKYRVITELGHGGMGTAYLAALTGPAEFRKLAVIKQLHPHLLAQPELVRMFFDEARLAARIDHPNVVQTFEIRVDGDRPYIAMEYIEGQSLDAILRKAQSSGREFPLALHLRILCEVLEGLHFAHELKDFDGKPLGLVHRDVSPHNVMVSVQGHAKLVDFGVAKAASSATQTASGVAKGKSAYMPLEQFEGLAVDRRADVFAVGVMLWQAATGKRMFSGRGEPEIYRMLIEGIPRPSSVAPDVSSELDAICMRALAKRRDDRYPSAAALLADLEALIAARSDLRASARDVAAWLEENFAADRARIRLAIESALGTSPATETEAGVVTAAAPEPTPAQARPSRRALGYAVALLAAIGVFGGVRVLRAARAVVPAAEGTTQIEVRVAPAGAAVRLDGAALEGSPARGTFRRDETRHHLRVERDGFEPYAEWIALSSGRVIVDVALRPIAERAPEAAAPAADAGASVAASAPPADKVRPPPTKATPAPIASPKTAVDAATTATPTPAPPASTRGSGLDVTIDPDNPFKRGPK